MTSQVSESRSESLPKLARIDPYRNWAESQGVPIVKGYYVEDMSSVELGPWPRKGGRGAILNLDTTGAKDAHIVEIAPGGTSEPEHHMYEEIVYVLFGRGATSIWYDEKHKQTFEWAQGSLFAIPLNAWYQHFNSSSEPVRYIAVTNLPPALRQYHNLDFIFDCPFQFTDRFGGEESYFNGQGKLFQERIWETGSFPTRAPCGCSSGRNAAAAGVRCGSSSLTPASRATFRASRWARTRRRTDTVPARTC